MAKKQIDKQQSIYLTLESNADLYPKDTALIYMGKSFSYSHVLKRVNQFAFALKEIGVKKDDVITLFLDNTPEALYLLYAIDQLGAFSDIVDQTYETEKIGEDLIKTGSKFLFVPDSRWEDFKKLILKGIKVYFVNPFGELGILKKLGHNIKNRKIKIPTEYKANWFYHAPYLETFDENRVSFKDSKEIVNLDTVPYVTPIKDKE